MIRVRRELSFPVFAKAAHLGSTIGVYKITSEEELAEAIEKVLTVDNKVVLPVDTNIRILTTSDDVIPNWAVPSFGLKLEATPGRTNESWVRIEREDTYYGMCSELCGANHGFMPIAVEAVAACLRGNSTVRLARFVLFSQDVYESFERALDAAGL